MFAGFVFSEEETTALVQLEGGPCAVIAPVQAFLLKNALFTSRSKTASDLSTVTGRIPDSVSVTDELVSV